MLLAASNVLKIFGHVPYIKCNYFATTSIIRNTEERIDTKIPATAHWSPSALSSLSASIIQLSSEQKELLEAVRAFSDKELLPLAQEIDRNNEFPRVNQHSNVIY